MQPHALIKRIKAAIHSTSRRWLDDLKICISCLVMSGLRPPVSEMYAVMPKQLRNRANAVKRLRTAFILIPAVGLASVITQISRAATTADAIQVTSTIFVLYALFLAIWRLAVASALNLAHDVHMWAAAEREGEAGWAAQPSDASALWAPWLPAGSKLGLRLKNAVRRK